MTTDPSAPGRRERKKEQTRQALAAAALRLFTERGFEQVTVAEIAAEADTAVTTLFKHFPGGKETLIFDDGTERIVSITAAVRDRSGETSVVDALRDFFLHRSPFEADPGERRPSVDLVLRTPVLVAYAHKLWLACADPLAEAIASSTGLAADDPSLRAFVRYVLDLPEVVGFDTEPAASLHAVFDRLAKGWPELA